MYGATFKKIYFCKLLMLAERRKIQMILRFVGFKEKMLTLTKKPIRMNVGRNECKITNKIFSLKFTRKRVSTIEKKLGLC